MATFNHIGGAEPSTLTFKAATVSMLRNSSVMHQELISLADPESSLSVARISSAAPASSDAGLIIRQVGYVAPSTTVSIAGPTSTAAPASNDTGVVVRVVGYSTIVSVAAFPANSSQVEVRALPANSSVVALGSIAAGLLSSAAAPANSSALLVRVVGGASSAADFISNVSSVAGIVTVRPSDTNWASSAGFHFDSSGALSVAASFSGSTGPLTISQLLDSSGGSITAGDSANQALRVNVVAGAAGGSTIVTVSTLPANSSVVAISGPTSTAAPASNDTGVVVRVVGYSTIVTVAAMPAGSTTVTVSTLPANSSQVEVRALPANSSNVAITGPTSTAAPAANDTGVVVRQVGFVAYSTTVSVAAMPAGSTSVTVSTFPANSSLVSLTQIAAGYLSTAVPAAASSGLNVWLVGGNRLNIGSTAADNAVTATIGTNLQSTAIPSSGSSGLIVRQVWDARSNAASTSAFATSTQFTISGSTVQQKYVTAYSLTSTDLTATVVRFMGGSTLAWCARMQTISSLITGVNLSAYPYIFKTDAASSLTLNISGSSRAGWTVAVSYFLAP